LKTKEEEMKKKRQGRPWRRLGSAEEALFGLNCGHDPERKTGKRGEKKAGNIWRSN